VAESEGFPCSPLALHGQDAIAELRTLYRSHRAETSGECATPGRHPRLPFALWVRRTGPRMADQDVSLLTIYFSVWALLFIFGAPLWLYVVAVPLALGNWMFNIRQPRRLLIWEPTGEQWARWGIRKPAG
jgi:hypothetical protein